MDDIQLCKEITRLKKELQKLVSIPGTFLKRYCTKILSINILLEDLIPSGAKANPKGPLWPMSIKSSH